MVSVLIDSVRVVIRGDVPHRKVNNRIDCSRDSRNSIQQSYKHVMLSN